MQLETTGADAGVLRTPTAAEAERASTRRAELLDAMGDRLEWHAARSKPAVGPLSPGCQRCAEGSWSCLFSNARCDASCFFCPRHFTDGASPAYAERIVFERPEQYAAYVETFGYRGASISGGEPFLDFERFVVQVRALRERCGEGLYLWAYTNGRHVTDERARQLADAGLDELRVNLVATGYGEVGLKSLETAARHLPTATVEIPAVPEDVERLGDLLPSLVDLGVAHLNLHQLMILGDNADRLRRRGYTFLHQPTWPVLESELAALEVMARCAREGHALGVQYCGTAFKQRWHEQSEARQAARQVMAPYEALTTAGNVRRLSLYGDRAALETAVRELTELAPGGAWDAPPDAGRVFLTPPLAAQLELDGLQAEVVYLRAITGIAEPSAWARSFPGYSTVSLPEDLEVGVRLVPRSAPLPLSSIDLIQLARGESPAFVRPFEQPPEGLPAFA